MSNEQGLRTVLSRDAVTKKSAPSIQLQSHITLACPFPAAITSYPSGTIQPVAITIVLDTHHSPFVGRGAMSGLYPQSKLDDHRD